MRLEYWWQDWHLEELLESYLPDFVLAFAFFTSIIYTVLYKRFEHQRPAIAMSAAIGLALSFGLVWWEQANDFSIKNLGPIAVGFAILLLAFVMYQCIRHIGGSWAGAGITIGASILIASLLGLKPPIAPEIIQTVTVVALVLGILAFLHHTQSHSIHFPHLPANLPDVHHNMSDLYREWHLSDQLGRRMRKLRKQSGTLNERPEDAGDVLLQLKRMLPAEGYLTERMANLRAKAHKVKNGHIVRLEETRRVFAKLPTSARKKAVAELAARYKQIIGIDTRLERLDKVVAENERKIRDLTRKAQTYAARYDYKKLYETIKAAEKLQHHNSKLFKIINRTENKLSATAKKVATEVKQIEKRNQRPRA